VSEPPSDVTAAWDRVVEQWDDAARHEKLIGLVAKHSCFAWAAAKYKDRAGDAIADKQLERLRKAATATLFATATRRQDVEQTPYKKTLIWLLALVAMLVLGLLLARLATKNTTPKPPIPVRQ
jgi:hypothetical protein